METGACRLFALCYLAAVCHHCTKGGVEFARTGIRQRTWSVFSSHMARRPSHSICKSAFKKSLERTHSTNAILFGELTHNASVQFLFGECDSIFSWFVSVSWAQRVCSPAMLDGWPSKCALPRLAVKMELTNWLFYICGNWLLGWSHHLSLGALFFIVLTIIYQFLY